MKKDKKVKEKRIKKKLSIETSSKLTTLIVILVTLGITIPLHFKFPDKLTSYWVIAICVSIICPFTLANFKINMEAKGNFTEEQKKAATSKLGIMMLSIWYADFTFVCMFMDWLIAFYVLAGLYLIKMIYNVTSVLVNRKDATAYPNFLIVGDFVLSFLLLILLIYKIPDQTLQTIVISLSAALIGGLLTLIGVVLTIKKTDMDRSIDEIKKAKPLVFIVNPTLQMLQDQAPIIKELFSQKRIGTIVYNKQSKKKYQFHRFYIKNSDFSYATLLGFKINEDYHFFDYGQLLDKNSFNQVISNYVFTYEGEIKYIALLFGDMLDHIYEFELDYIISDSNNIMGIVVKSGLEMKKSNITFTSEK